MYPALAVLDRLGSEYPDVKTLWIGSEHGMEVNLVAKAGITYKRIPAAGVHGVGIRHLPGNIIQILKGIAASRRLLQEFQPDVIFFTGGYVAFPMAVAGFRIPQVLYVPDIEPGLALKSLAFTADSVAITVGESKKYFLKKGKITVTGYPVRDGLSNWQEEDAYEFFNFTPEIPTLLVTGGSLGSLSINQAVVNILPDLLSVVQIIHITGTLTWDQFSDVRSDLNPEERSHYRSFPYLHDEMGAAFSIADLVLSRAGASCIGEYPHFGIPAILVPYPHAWQYQKINAEYLVKNGAASMISDDQLPTKLLPLVKELVLDSKKLGNMKSAMSSLSTQNSASLIAKMIYEIHSDRELIRN